MNQAFRAGEIAGVPGELRSLVVADIEHEYDLTWDLDLQKLEADIEKTLCL
jgi:hypothetical protein